MDGRIVPNLLSFEGIDTVNPVVSRAEIDLSLTDKRARFDVTGCWEIPDDRSIVSIKGMKAAIGIVMKSLADINPPTDNCG
jgi:hypothetical protein